MLILENISKSYDDINVLKNVSIQFNPGEIYGLIGINGSGKSTLLNIINSYIKSDTGFIKYFNKNEIIHGENIRKYTNTVLQEIALIPKLSVWDNFRYWGGINKIHHNIIKIRGIELLRSFNLYDVRFKKVEYLSVGMKRLVHFATSILKTPYILLLDEPTVGIDYNNRQLLISKIIELKKNGSIIVFASHYLEEVEKICDRIGILHQGTIKIQGKTDDIIERIGSGERVIITVDHIPNIFKMEQNYKVSDNTIEIICSDTFSELQNIINQISEKQIKIKNINFYPYKLEKSFIHFTTKER